MNIGMRHKSIMVHLQTSIYFLINIDYNNCRYLRMKTLIRYLFIIFMLAGCCQTLSAQELVFPPEGLPKESWIMKFNDYRHVKYLGYEQIYERPVTLVWGDQTVYIKGIFSDYPDSWVKGTVSGNEIRFDDYQLICELDIVMGQLESVFGMAGAVYEDYYSGMNSAEYIDFLIADDNNRIKDNYIVKFTISGDRARISSEVILDPQYAHENHTVYSAFWYDVVPRDIGYDIYYYHGNQSGTGFPDVDFPSNVQFEKTGGGIDDIRNDADLSDSVTYDLYGRRVNPDNLRPGIYIRNGEKILVK